MGYQLGALWKENINLAEVMSATADWGKGRKQQRRRGRTRLWIPSRYVLKEMEKANIWLSTVGSCWLNDCASGKKHAQWLLLRCLIQLSGMIATLYVHLWIAASLCTQSHMHACVFGVCALVAWLKCGGLCCFQSLSHIFRHQIDKTEQQLH